MKSEKTFTLYGDLPDILGFRRRDERQQQHQSRVVYSFDGCTRLLHRRFEARFRIAICLFEHRRTAHRRRQDCTAATNSADNRKPRIEGDGPFRPRPVHSRVESRIWLRRNRDKGRHGPTCVIRTREGDGDASLSTVQLRVIQMNYDDYYERPGGWGTALLYRRSCPEGARVWKFVQWSPPNGCPSDQNRCCRFGEACADDWSADCWQCRGW